MPARMIMNPKIVMALVLCVSFLVAASFDERAGADVQNNHTPTQTSVPIAE